jgi:hypothetical protein
MTTLQIDDKLAASLLAQARARGLSLERYLQLLTEAQAPAVAPIGETADSVRQFDAAIQELFAADTRDLPADSSTHPREEIYLDHD